jgi:hypothetical protein
VFAAFIQIGNLRVSNSSLSFFPFLSSAYVGVRTTRSQMIFPNTRLYLMQVQHSTTSQSHALSSDGLRSGDVASFHLLYNLFAPALISELEPVLTKKEAARMIHHAFIYSWLQCEQITSLDYAIGLLQSSTLKMTERLSVNNLYAYCADSILASILQPSIGEGEDEAALLRRLNELSTDQHISAREVLSLQYKRLLSTAEIADLTFIDPLQIENLNRWARQSLHLIFTATTLNPY